MDNSEKIRQVAQWVVEAKHLVIFTGAGISTESGIPDFRSPGGVWDRFDPDEFTYQKFLFDEEARRKSWEVSQQSWPVIREANPNKAHLAIAELEQLGKLEVVITQNIDDLHQRSGVPEEKIIELHGTTKYVYCIECGKRYSREVIQEWLDAGDQSPMCDDCSGILKSATVAFGEPMPVEEVEMAEKHAKECDLFIVIGSSLVVYPAAQLPLTAKRHGGKLVIINMSSTPHDAYADMVINGKAGEIMPQLVDELKELLSKN
jgi:NAD-dependent deacetylase